MPQLLICFLQPGSDPSNRKDSGEALRPRQPPFASDLQAYCKRRGRFGTWERRSRYRRNLKLWAGLFTLPTFSESVAIALERASRYRPVVLKKRFAAALLIRNRKRFELFGDIDDLRTIVEMLRTLKRTETP